MQQSVILRPNVKENQADDSPSHMELCICLHALTDWFLSLWRVVGGGVRHLVGA